MKARWMLLFAAALVPASARAGDAPAHTTAMLTSAREIAAKPDYAKGVGAPLVNHVTQPGLFRIPTAGSVACKYNGAATYGDSSCFYSEVNGLAVNEPDSWGCFESGQPWELNAVGAIYAFRQSMFETVAALGTERAAMACNWSHFSNNSALPPEASAAYAVEVTKRWADAIPSAIEARTQVMLCDITGWVTYYRRVANALHFVQDMQSEHHDLGNLACSFLDVVPLTDFNDRFTFKNQHTCSGWLSTAFQHAEGAPPQVPCDEAVAAKPDVTGMTHINPDMQGIIGLCDAGVPLACMGLERTARHHCRFPDAPKTLTCSGPADDHQSVTDKVGYCEGEIYPGGGEDFIAKAVSASVPYLEEAAKRWASVCKQPDDPCKTDQCTTWCERSQRNGFGGRAITGYCLNQIAGDDHCVLHECVCAFADDCGATGQQCCRGDAPPCTSANDECGPSTGKCVPIGTGTCHPDFSITLLSIPAEVPTDSSVGLAAHIREKIPANSTITWSWTHAGVGSIETMPSDANRADSYARFNSGSGEGTASFTVTALVTVPGGAETSVVPVKGTTQVKKGLTQIVMEASGGVFACTDPKACGVAEYTAFIVPVLSKAMSYTAELSGFATSECNRSVTWSTPQPDNMGCNFPVTYHPHNATGPTDSWAVWAGFGGPLDGGKCVVTITLNP